MTGHLAPLDDSLGPAPYCCCSIAPQVRPPVRARTGMPPPKAARDPKSLASTNSATGALPRTSYVGLGSGGKAPRVVRRAAPAPRLLSRAPLGEPHHADLPGLAGLAGGGASPGAQSLQGHVYIALGVPCPCAIAAAGLPYNLVNFQALLGQRLRQRSGVSANPAHVLEIQRLTQRRRWNAIRPGALDRLQERDRAPQRLELVLRFAALSEKLCARRFRTDAVLIAVPARIYQRQDGERLTRRVGLEDRKSTRL